MLHFDAEISNRHLADVDSDVIVLYVYIYIYMHSAWMYTYSLRNLLFFGVTEKTWLFKKNLVSPNPLISKTMIP